jgi:hypothetical protein
VTDSDVDAVTVAYVHANEVAYSWHHSMQQLLMADLGAHRRVMRGGIVAIRCPSAGQLGDARNRAVRHFLAGDAPWLFMVDTDMGFDDDVLERLLDAADPEARPVVGALCYASREVEEDGMGGWRTEATATIYDWADHNGMGRLEVRCDVPAGELVACDGTGAACLLVHRSVLERVQERYGAEWFDRIPARDGSMGEDLSFCMRARALDVPVHVHTGIRTSHMKTTWLQPAAESVAELAAAAAP